MEHFYDAAKMGFKCDFYLLFVMKQRGNGLFYCLVSHRKKKLFPWRRYREALQNNICALSRVGYMSSREVSTSYFTGRDLCRLERDLCRAKQRGSYVILHKEGSMLNTEKNLCRALQGGIFI